MLPDVDEQNFIPLDNQFKHDPVADVDGYRRQTTQVSLEIVQPRNQPLFPSQQFKLDFANSCVLFQPQPECGNNSGTHDKCQIQER